MVDIKKLIRKMKREKTLGILLGLMASISLQRCLRLVTKNCHSLPLLQVATFLEIATLA